MSIEQDNLVAVLRRAIADDEQDAAVGVYAVLAYLWTLQGAHSEVLAFGAPVWNCSAATGRLLPWHSSPCSRW